MPHEEPSDILSGLGAAGALSTTASPFRIRWLRDGEERMDSRPIPPFFPSSIVIPAKRDTRKTSLGTTKTKSPAQPSKSTITKEQTDPLPFTTETMHTIFYSWQKDCPNNTNRGLIKTALEDAATALTTDLHVEPRIDHDTKDTPGSPDITRTILKKIDDATVFVADITIINDPKDEERPTPNPNVLIELGYAIKALGEERVILIMNEHFGPVEQLPFDLRARRTIVYNAAPEDAEKSPERRRLASTLKDAIKAAINTIPTAPPPPDEIETAINAIEAAAPNRALIVRRAMNTITKELEGLTPPSFRDNGTTAQYLEAIEATIPTVERFTRITDSAAAMNDPEAARAIYRSLTTILEHYDNPKGFQGGYNEADFDYWKFLGHELTVSLIAPLLTEERYEIITDLLAEPLPVKNARYQDGKPVEYTYASEWLQSFEKLDQEHGKISYHGYLLQQRHDGPLAGVLPLSAFVAADYLLFLRGEIEQNEWQERGVSWVPWSSVYLRETPHFIHNAARKTVAEQLATTFGAPDVPTLKARLTERAGKLARIWGNIGPRRQPLTNEQVERIGTK